MSARAASSDGEAGGKANGRHGRTTGTEWRVRGWRGQRSLWLKRSRVGPDQGGADFIQGARAGVAVGWGLRYLRRDASYPYGNILIANNRRPLIRFKATFTSQIGRDWFLTPQMARGGKMLGPIENALKLLERLESDCPVLNHDGMSALQRSTLELRSVTDPTVRVALIGEFNAGKSTLVNALIGRQVAPTDILEMTSWIAVYRPGRSDRCDLLLSDGQVRRLPLVEFQARAARRAFSAAELSLIERVEIEIEGSDLQVALIDPPGLGSVTIANERRMLDALFLADLVLWAVDVDSIGGIREISLIERVRQAGAPIGVVLTKCDRLDDDDNDELNHLIEYVADRAGIRPDLVFTTAANSPGDVGTKRLRDHLIHHVPLLRADLRQQSADAHYNLARSEAVALLTTVHQWLEELQSAGQELDDLDAARAAAVRGEVADHMEQWVRRTFLAEHRAELVEMLAPRLAEGQAAARQVIHSTVPVDYLDRYWVRFVDEATNTYARAWAIRGGSVTQQSHTAMPNRVDVPALQPLSKSILQDMVKDDSVQNSMKTVLGTAAAATAFAAWFGPAVGIGAAISGVGLPILLIGAGVSYVLHAQRTSSQAVAKVAAAESVLNGLAQQFAEAAVLGPLADTLDAMEAQGPEPRVSVAGRSPAVWKEDVERALRRLQPTEIAGPT